MPQEPAGRDRLIVALDCSSVEEAQTIVDGLGDSVGFYKVGLELVCAGGLAFAERLVGAGKRVFLDLKMHDIPNTVERAVAQVERLGVDLLTIHAYPQTMAAARHGARAGLRLLAVTVLTSSDDADLAAAGYAGGVTDLVTRRASQAKEAGIDGIVLSPQEVASARAALGPDMLLVTPGIRAVAGPSGDQKRVMTAVQAIGAGADLLVIGRPITQAADRRGAAQAFLDEIAAAA